MDIIQPYVADTSQRGRQRPRRPSGTASQRYALTAAPHAVRPPLRSRFDPGVDPGSQRQQDGTAARRGGATYVVPLPRFLAERRAEPWELFAAGRLPMVTCSVVVGTGSSSAP